MAAPLAVGIIGVTVTASLAVIAAAGQLSSQARAAVAADNSALAAADALYGSVYAEPCEIAARVAAAHGASLTGCEVGELDAVVRVAVPSAFGPVTGSARAGSSD